MSGIYFIAAGKSSKNREKSLDRSLQATNVANFLDRKAGTQFSKIYGPNDAVYAWGANKIGDLAKLNPGDFVVDVKNKEVVRVFRFGFWTKSENTSLQDYIGWDSEKSKEDRRSYRFVYFLTDPTKTSRLEKAFFQYSFSLSSNPQWLVRQKWFSDIDVRRALSRTNTRSVEQFLGIVTESETVPNIAVDQEPTPVLNRQPERFERPTWLASAIDQVEMLKKDPNHQERDHEDVVSRFFECLGYQRGRDIKFQRGRIDVGVEHDGKPIIVIEVKRDWSLTKNSTSYIEQGFKYALKGGVRYVAITNGDRYVIYDRLRGLSYDDAVIADIALTRLKPSDINVLTELSPVALHHQM